MRFNEHHTVGVLDVASKPSSLLTSSKNLKALFSLYIKKNWARCYSKQVLHFVEPLRTEDLAEQCRRKLQFSSLQRLEVLAMTMWLAARFFFFSLHFRHFRDSFRTFRVALPSGLEYISMLPLL